MSLLKQPTNIAEGFFKDRGSKFHGVIFPFSDTNELKSKLESSHEMFPQARHYCFAYITGVEQLKERANDDGEPAHSAGTPILNVLRSLELTNALIVVARYFGGTKLGVPGLIQAYREAAHEAAIHAKKADAILTDRFSITFDYDNTSLVNQALNDFSLISNETTFNERCHFSITIDRKDSEKFRSIFSNLHRVEFKPV